MSQQQSWPPSSQITQYIGHYPRSDLEKARSTLISCLQSQDSYFMEQIKIKMGVPNIYGWTSLPPALETSCSSSSLSPGQTNTSCSTSSGLLTSAAALSQLGRTSSLSAAHSCCTLTSGKRGREDDDEPVRKKKRVSPSSDGLPHNGTYQVYKCDVCLCELRHLYQIQKHLDDHQHVSASLYNTDGKKLISTEQLHSIKQNKGRKIRVFFSCPECQAVFDHVLMCGTHYMYWHGSTTGLYQPCAVAIEKKVPLPINPICGICQLRFEDHQQLNEHWRLLTEHNPFKPVTESNIITFCTCPYCSETFVNDIIQCQLHVVYCHRSFGVPGSLAQVSMKHLQMPSMTGELPPYERTHNKENGLEMEMNVLSSLWQLCTKDMHRTRPIRMMLTSRISELTKLLKSSKEVPVT